MAPEQKENWYLEPVLAKLCRDRNLKRLGEVLRENPKRKWVSITLDLSIKENRPQVTEWLVLEQGIEPPDISLYALRGLVEVNDWRMIQILLGRVGLDVNAYGGILLRTAVEQGDFEGIRLLLATWRADVGLLDGETAGAAASQDLPKIIDLLVAHADPGSGREELLHLLMQGAVRAGKVRAGKYLLDTHGVDLNAHRGLYPRLALLHGIFPEEWMKTFFARGLSQEALVRLPLETAFSRPLSDPLQVLLATHLDYRMFFRQIENALEVQAWDLQAKEEMVALQRREGYPAETQEKELARERERALHQRRFCQLWRVWDNAEFPKEELAEIWPKVLAAQQKADMTDKELERFLRSLLGRRPPARL